MKNKFIIINLLILSAVLTSCLDDDKAALDPEGVQNVIEFLDPSVPSSPSGAVYPAYSSSFVLAPEADLEMVINYSGPEDGNSNDIQLQLAVDPVALELYNTQMVDGLYGKDGLNGTTYDLMPEANYAISAMTVTIPKGQRSTTLPIKVFPEQFDFSKNYAIPLRIVSASHGALSAHYSVAIIAVGVRNQYDGVYEIVGGNIQRNSGTGPDPALSGDYVEGLTLELGTLSSNSVSIEPVWKDGSGVGGIAGTALNIDPSTNQVIVTSSNPSLKNTPATINAYDPATKEFTLSFAWGAAPSTRVISDLKLRYVSPRP
jgi:hypothetical protein